MPAKPPDPWKPEEDPHVLAAKKRQARVLLIGVPFVLVVALVASWVAPQGEPACMRDAKFYADRAQAGNATARQADATLAQTYLMLQSMGKTCELVDDLRGKP